ncbi:MAG TPA: histidine phosphatase family protein [Candidatus Nanoarchaeia archaeon]|nr:histidine phosphatase family protein [Candidatus Nanoarchaeia archaeon]
MKKRKEEFYIYLFRHGQTYYNKRGIFTGWKDSNLTPLGIRQAKKISGKLKNKKVDVAFQTRLGRSQDTLKIVLKFHPECKKILVDNRMIERNYGKLNGTSHEVFIKNIGKRALDLRIEGDAIDNLDPKLRKQVERFLGEKEYQIIHRGYNIPPPGGESFSMVEKRVKSFIKYLKSFIKKNRVNVAISAHGNSIRLFMKIMENLNINETEKLTIPYDKVFVYKVSV